MARPVFSDIDSYIASFPPATQEKLQEIRTIIRQALPEGITEVMSYGIPTFKHQKNIVHFAGYKHHIGFYPGAAPIVAFQEALAGYKTAKGSIQFPLEQPLPIELIQAITEFRLKQING